MVVCAGSIRKGIYYFQDFTLTIYKKKKINVKQGVNTEQKIKSCQTVYKMYKKCIDKQSNSSVR